MNWIMDRRKDLKWIIGPAVISFIVVILYYGMTALGLGVTLTLGILYLSWTLLFDGTHVFATYTRTYFDREFRSQNNKALLYSLLILVVGPLLILFFYLTQGIGATRAAAITFNRFGLLYAYYHLIRQHWGFISYYRGKNGEKDLKTKRYDALLIGFGSLYPLFQNHLLYYHPFSLAERFSVSYLYWQQTANSSLLIGLCLVIGCMFLKYFKNIEKNKVMKILFKSSFVFLGISVFIHLALMYGLSSVLKTLATISLVGFFLSAVFAIYHAVSNLKHNSFNLPKWLLIGAVLITHNVILLINVPITIPFIALTIFHNIQYHRFIRFHNVNKYLVNEGKVKFGLAFSVTEKLILFVVLAFLFDMFITLPRAINNQIMTYELLNYTLGALFWGVAFHHYILDAFIWSRRKNKDLSQTLKIQQDIQVRHGG
ncbi:MULTISPECIES: hypothetical protein [Bacillus]|uniref:hypothetical protein n=1 Tax=Bacillus TaxID=1386 RepID=UPI0001CE3B75|nr:MULTISPECIES: hypothetical protein [Bacillus]AMK73718.1 hypothetical protein AWV81_17085 [Bacillus subtilis subsp. natto]AOR99599.1 hypothetical protein BSBS38_03347 [Bacillus subtilis]AOS69354.1 hypothetical protein A4A60_17640 [Bacillus subtilis]API43428.1 hypothetical protein BSR08_13410 [Bacillus subtilis]API97458.1 hypothetical protein BKP58_17250 [Bacillus subtilis]